jgi:hypothetical protein
MNDRPPSDESMSQWSGGVRGRGWYAPGPGEPIPEPTNGDEGLQGNRIRFFWDYGCEVPLWDGRGNLPADPEWLVRELGLSQALIADLLAYVAAQELHPTVEGDEEDRLFRRIQDELAEGLTVVRD